MNSQSVKIILVEDNPADAELIEELLAEVSNARFEVKRVCRLGDGLNCLRQAEFDIILLDLSLPDSEGIDTIVRVKTLAPTIPIVILTALDDRTIALESVRQGAQDYLVKGRFEGELLVRTIRYAIARQRDREQLRQQVRRSRLLERMLERIRQFLALEYILQTTVSEVRQFLKTDRVLIYRYQPESPEKLILESFDCEDCEAWNPEIYSTLFLPCLGNLKEDSLDFYEDVKRARMQLNCQHLKAHFQIKSILTVPILQGKDVPNKLWGFLMAHHCQTSRKWQEWEINFLKQLASQVAIAIQQSELYRQLKIANKKLQQLVSLDGLTSIANRRFFDEVINKEWQRLTREKNPLSLILCDIDFFKLYNDNYGHVAGDDCLQKVALAIAKTATRSADLVARYGGEEFAIILPATDTSGAIAVARGIRQKLAELRLPHAPSPINQYVTLSCGIATTIPRADGSPAALIEAADEALYKSKAKGRDTCYVHPSLSYFYSQLSS